MAVDPSRGQDCPGRLMPAGLLGRLQPSESSRAQPQTAQSRLTRYQRHRQSYVPGGVSSRVRDGDGWKDGKRRSSPWWYGVSRPSMPPTHSRRAAGWWSWSGWHSGPGRPRTGLPTRSSTSWPTSWGRASGRRRRRRPGRRGARAASQVEQPRGGARDAGRRAACQRPVRHVRAREGGCENFLFPLKAGRAGGRLPAAVLGRQRHHRPRPGVARPRPGRAGPRLLLHGYGHAVTHQHLGAVGAHHAKDDVELEARGTRRGRRSLEMRCTRSAL
jgi:hypothetical protein